MRGLEAGKIEQRKEKAADVEGKTCKEDEELESVFSMVARLRWVRLWRTRAKNLLSGPQRWQQNYVSFIMEPFA